MTKITVGRMLGMVIEKKRRTAPAPSIAAASYRSRDTACMAASRIRALYPVHRQLTIDPIATWLASRSRFHSIGSSPTALSRLFARLVSALLRKMLETVSYTHLRAHETRHDLVCRLLLEKKKK